MHTTPPDSDRAPRVPRWHGAALVAAFALFAAGCSADGAEAASDTTDTTDATGLEDAQAADAGGAADGASSDSGGEITPPACLAGQLWAPGTPLFVERTEAWGLQGVTAQHFHAVDLDGDGDSDVVARDGGGGEERYDGSTPRRMFVLRNDGGTFVDVTAASGLFASRVSPDPARGVGARALAFGDVDGDGDLDAFVGRARVDPAAASAERSEILLNQGDGTFALGPAEHDARFETVASSPAGATFVDVNRDGLLDLWVVHNERPGQLALPDTLLLGNGTGRFTNISAGAGLATLDWIHPEDLDAALGHSWGWGSAACDLNGDGWPELLASSYGRAPNHLWHATPPGDGGVRYENASVSSGFAYDGDERWWLDLSAQCYCSDNPDAEQCDKAPAPASLEVCAALKNAFGPNYRWDQVYGRSSWRLGGNTGPVLCADLNGDAHMDVLTGEIIHSDTGPASDRSDILLGMADAAGPRLVRPGAALTGLTRERDEAFWDQGDMTAEVLDVDLDGHNDVFIGSAEYAGTRAQLFMRTAEAAPSEPDGPVVPVFTEVDVLDFFERMRAHGVAILDIDGDGDEDLLVGHSQMRCDGPAATECDGTNRVRAFENVFGQDNNRFALHIAPIAGHQGTAIGARVEVETATTRQIREVEGGHGRFGAQRPATLIFGLGAACEATVRVRWPDSLGTTATFTLAAGVRWSLQPDGTAVAQASLAP